MKSHRWVPCIAMFLFTLLAVGVPYWRIPYSKVFLPDSLADYGLVVAFATAVVGHLVFRVSLLQAFASVGLAIPAAVLARVEYDTYHDPTSHNLWPLEVIIAGTVGMAVGFCGAMVGGLFKAATRKRFPERGATR